MHRRDCSKRLGGCGDVKDETVRGKTRRSPKRPWHGRAKGLDRRQSQRGHRRGRRGRGEAVSTHGPEFPKIGGEVEDLLLDGTTGSETP